MKKDEWEKLHSYRPSAHSCSSCKHVRTKNPTPWEIKYECEEKEKAGAGKNTKSTYECDLWEKE